MQWRALALAALISALALWLWHVLDPASAPLTAAPSPVARNALSSLPPAAQGPVSGALGADSAAYRLSAAAGGFRASSPAEGLSERFNSAGVSLRMGALAVGLSLRAAGYGSSLRDLGHVTPNATANRVSYARGGVNEWYVNGPLGLEQGFTITRSPAREPTLPLTLAIALSGNANPSLSAAGQSVRLSRPGSRSLRYGGLSASDASGRALPSRLELHGRTLLLYVDTRGARYPLRVDPLIQQEPELKLTGGEEANSALFGYSVALSADGNTALIGGPRDSSHYGAAWVFVREGSTWVQQGPKLIGSQEAGEAQGEHCGEEAGEESDECSFGRSVALSADGNTALIGDSRAGIYVPPSSGEGEPRWVANEGAAWVFTRAGSTWTQQGPKLTGGEETAEGRFAKSVALSGDGDTAAIGGSSDTGGRGAVWIFTRSSSGWPQQGPKLTGAAESGEGHFGRSVALSGDGNTALIGGPGDSGYTGAAWAFTRLGTIWNQEGPKLTGGEEIGEGHFGYSVALSSDASTAVIGGRRDNGGAGAAWIFTQSAPNWIRQGAKLTGGEASDEEFGYSVALSSDGSTALIGAPENSGARGAAWLLERSGTSWNAPGVELEAGVEEIGRASFGSSVALSGDAQTAFVGGPTDHGKVGAAWVFGPDPSVTGVSPSSGPEGGGTTVTITGANLGAATAVSFGQSATASFTVSSAGSITAVTPPGTGRVDVTVSTPQGTSATSSDDRYTYTKAKGKKGSGGESPASGGESPGSGTGGSIELGAGPAAGTGAVLAFGTSAPGACRVTLLSHAITVSTHSRAALKLLWKGGGTCSGRLTLLVKTKAAHKKLKTRAIAAGSFSLTGGRARIITLKLNSTGRSLLRAAHGRLSARLTILRLSPAPRATQTATVRLTLQRTHDSRAHGK